MVTAALAGPPAGGQDEPEACRDKYGDEAILALMHHRDGPDTSVVLRYSGSDHNGVDDGLVVRALTRSVVAPLTGGPNAPTHWDGGGPSKAVALGLAYTEKDDAHDRAKYGRTLGQAAAP